MPEHDPSRFPGIDIQHRAGLTPLTEDEVHFEIDLWAVIAV